MWVGEAKESKQSLKIETKQKIQEGTKKWKQILKYKNAESVKSDSVHQCNPTYLVSWHRIIKTKENQKKMSTKPK